MVYANPMRRQRNLPPRVDGAMKTLILGAALFFSSILPAAAQSYYDIDVDLPAYPEMQPIPESPV